MDNLKFIFLLSAILLSFLMSSDIYFAKGSLIPMMRTGTGTRLIPKANENRNDRPIVGILAQEVTSKKMRTAAGVNTTSSFIAASYVKWVESAGGRVVPILLNQPKDYYAHLMSKINGVLFPGGAVSLTESGYGHTGKLLYEIAKEMNQQGNYFPIWGTCLGFELLTLLTADGYFLSSCNAENISLPLQFQNGSVYGAGAHLGISFKGSRMFSGVSQEIHDILADEDSTANSHRKCLTPASFSFSGLNNTMRALAYSTESDGVTFLAAVEDVRYPFFGVQFHPEKANFEFHHAAAFSHSPHAVLASQYLANFFVSQARKNGQQFDDQEEEDKYLIYNWNSMFSKATIYDQVYVFT